MRYLAILIASALSAAGLFFALALALAPAPIAAEYWVREMIVIKRHLVRRYLGQPKILIASGSSTLFDIDTNQLADEFGIPVINLGLHAELPLQTILGEAGAAAEKGDTIILPLEPTYYCMKQPTGWQVRNAIAWDRDRWNAWSILDRIQAVALLSPTLIFELAQARRREALSPDSVANRLAALDDRKILAKFASSPEPRVFAYSAYNLDSLGNMRKTAGGKLIGVPRSAEESIDICPESWQLLRSFAATMSHKGVAIYFANTPYVASNYANKERIEEASRQLNGALSMLAPVLDSRPPLVFPRSMYLNTDLHLNEEGRKIRTAMLANAIRQDANLLARIRQRPPGDR